MEGVECTPPLAELMSRSPSHPHPSFPLSLDKGEKEMTEEEWCTEDSTISELQGTEKNKTLGLYDQDSMILSPTNLEMYENENKNVFFQISNENYVLKDDIVDAVLHESKPDQIEQLQIENLVLKLIALPYSAPEDGGEWWEDPLTTELGGYTQTSSGLIDQSSLDIYQNTNENEMDYQKMNKN